MADKPKVTKVSLSGKTRLTYREAVALLGIANEGLEDLALRLSDDDQSLGTEAAHVAAERAIRKLKDALGNAGGYDANGNLYDPFDAD